ncbi:lysophospholipase L2 [Serratia sp. AKBS12]|uniref:lysophospholipase L2 n=1 Tax=Serratia sp. AKBS12 TaxID=2974597 RepID=UPI0021666DBE|nr:lysophospholipase L2 [Serratia sp. AKBS12]MCS3406696.1 lysophospholipase L2 [Serratia sp. AKBS12]HEI8868043.1 lysophospholipase L2 [Serratia odorifera]
MTSFILSPDEWLTRETHFAAFATGPLLDFWRQRQEGEFSGVGGVPIRFVRFSASHHRRVVVISPGRIESYVKYPEVAYDLFHCGYDVMILDHRGQGRSGRLLADPHRGHVVNFADYVEDFSRFYQQEVVPLGYRQRVALAHSMGGAILAQFLARQPQAFDAAALCAPMFGIILPMPVWMASRILNWAEKHPSVRDYYAIGTGQWRPLPYVVNMLTHSRERYRRAVRYYADYPELQLGGPTYHWVRESMLAGQRAIAGAAQIATPLLLLQASEDRVVDNRSHRAFCQALSDAGHPCEGGKPRVINGARHEILFERDAMRAEALNAILRFFAQHLGGNPTADNSIRG